jgi:hypothetical protein
MTRELNAEDGVMRLRVKSSVTRMDEMIGGATPNTHTA